MDWATSHQAEHYDEARGRLCEKLVDDPDTDAMRTARRIADEAQVAGRGTIFDNGERATVRLSIEFPPFPKMEKSYAEQARSGQWEVEDRGDPWLADMVKEDGRWKVCGFEPEKSKASE